MNSGLKYCTSLALVSLLGMSFTTNAHAQAKTNVQASGWFKTCENQEGSKICNIQYRIVANNGNIVTGLSLLEITGDVKRRLFQIIVPTARSLPQGVQVRVDNKQSTSVPYSFCRPNFCVAEAVLTDGLVKILKAGGKLDVTSINFQGTENPVPITLKGFTSAYDGEPVKQQEPVQSSQDKLKEQLKKKVEAGEIKAE